MDRDANSVLLVTAEEGRTRIEDRKMKTSEEDERTEKSESLRARSPPLRLALLESPFVNISAFVDGREPGGLQIASHDWRTPQAEETVGQRKK